MTSTERVRAFAPLLIWITNQQIFFAMIACSWMPHWACHYFRLATGSSFVVGSWTFNKSESEISIVIYSLLVVLNLVAIARAEVRFVASLASGVGHSSIGSVHLLRIVRPFAFLVLGQSMPVQASAVQVMILIPLGTVCLLNAARLKRKSKRDEAKI